MSRTYLVRCFMLVLFLLPSGIAKAQQFIDDAFPFQNLASKKYSLYIPSEYDENEPSNLVLGLHPLHQQWGNSTTWRNILANFAEANNLILAVPDGGADLRIDDPIDQAFTTALLDSVETWYNINTDKEFILGFSWGARGTYSYGLQHHNRFAGFITIGAFINGVAGLSDTQLSNAKDKPFYIMHGDLDNVAPINIGFFPIRDTLAARGAIVESLILQGVDHTIEFPNREAILTEAYRWVDSVHTGLAVSTEGLEDNIPKEVALHQNYPNPFNPTTQISYTLANPSNVNIEIFDAAGKSVGVIESSFRPAGRHTVEFDATNLASGIYLYRLQSGSFIQSRKMLLIK